MADRVIDNPILNPPYEEPSRHFLFDDQGITDEVAPTRRRSSYFVPIPRPRKQKKQLEGALRSLYDNYGKGFRRWESSAAAGETPPVFIVVCNNTNVSRLVFNFVAGWEKRLDDDSTVVVPGALPLFSNERDGGWSPLPAVASYVKNDHLGFAIPYTLYGQTKQYLPDFLVRLADAEDDDVQRTLVVEVSGGHKPQAPTEEKAASARDLWVPAVNNHGGFGRRGYVEVTDPTLYKAAVNAAAQTLYASGLVPA